MGNMSQFLEVYCRINLNIAQRVKVFDRHIELLCKKLRGVSHDRCAAGKKQSLRRRAALLSSIKLHRLIHLNVQPRHKLTRYLGNGCLVDRKSTRLNSSHVSESRMPSSA